jgi:hypothetical protein
MTILRKHGINSVTQENIQQVSTLLQSLDIPFDLSGVADLFLKFIFFALIVLSYYYYCR